MPNPFEKQYNDDYRPMTIGNFVVIEMDHHILKERRANLGMTQQEVADAAKILLRQYQRLESGERTMASSSFRIGLSVCHALKLDPYRFVYFSDD